MIIPEADANSSRTQQHNPDKDRHRHTNIQLARRYDEWMIALHYTAHTRQYAQKVLRRFNALLGERSVSRVTHLEIRKFLTHISNYGATLETVYRHLGVLRRFYDFLNLGGVVSYVPPRLVRMKHFKRTNLPIFSESDIKRLLDATRTLRERAIIELIYGTGCRLREATHLRVEDIHFENRCASVQGKFGKSRMLFIPKSSLESLKTYLNGRTCGYVFQNDMPQQKASLSVVEGCWVVTWVDYAKKFPCGKFKPTRKVLGRVEKVPRDIARRMLDELLKDVELNRPLSNYPLTNPTVLHIINAVGRRAGFKTVGVHTLRRSFATHLYDHGAPIEIIQALLGHVYLGTTLGYTRLSRKRIAKVMDQSHPLALPYET